MSRVVGDIAIDVSADIGPLVRDMGQGSAAISRFGKTADSVRNNLGRLDDTTRRFRTGMQTATRDSGAFGRGIQNAAFQVGDFAVQVGGGTSAMRAMSMQLPQLLGGFGVFGAVAGAVVAILGPLAQSLFSGAEGASEQQKALDALSGSLGSMRSKISELGNLQQRLNDLHRAQAGASAAGASAVLANTQKEYDARKQLIEVERTLLRLRSQDAIQALNALRSQQDAARESMQERLRTLGPGSTDSRNAGAEGFAGGGLRLGDIETAIGGDSIDQMRQRLIQIKELEAQLALAEIAADEATTALDNVFDAPGEVVGAGSGGGGGGSPRTEALREQLSRQEQIISEHMSRIKALTEGGLSEQLGAWGSYFNNLGNMAGKSGEKLLRIAKAFGAAQALVDAWRAHNAVLADPALPWWMRIASAGQVLAAGLGAVNAIKGVSAGGSGGASGGATSGAAAAANTSPRVAITLTGSENAMYSKQQVRDLINAINQEVENGAIVRLA